MDGLPKRGIGGIHERDYELTAIQIEKVSITMCQEPDTWTGLSQVPLESKWQAPQCPKRLSKIVPDRERHRRTHDQGREGGPNVSEETWQFPYGTTLPRTGITK